MLDSILDKVKEEVGGSLMEKFGLGSDQADQAFSLTGDTIKETIQGESAGGGLNGVLNLFSSDDNNDEGNSLLSSLTSNLTEKFTSKLGVDSSKSSGIADMLIGQVTKVVGDKLGSGFDASSLLGLLGGGKADGIGSVIGKIGGLFGK